MHRVGVRELKNRLTHYLSRVREGVTVVVTDRNEPIAVLHGLDAVDENAGLDERLAALAHAGALTLPSRKVPFPPVRRAKAKGRPASEMLLEDRR